MRTAQEIIDQTNQMARIMYRILFGCEVPEGTTFHDKTINRRPHETGCWLAACEMQELLTQTDPEDALNELEDESE